MTELKELYEELSKYYGTNRQRILDCVDGVYKHYTDLFHTPDQTAVYLFRSIQDPKVKSVYKLFMDAGIVAGSIRREKNILIIEFEGMSISFQSATADSDLDSFLMHIDSDVIEVYSVKGKLEAFFINSRELKASDVITRSMLGTINPAIAHNLIDRSVATISNEIILFGGFLKTI